MSTENIEKFIDEFAASLRRETFVKMTLGNYKGVDEHLQKLLVRLIKTKKGIRLFFLYRYNTRDTVRNFGFKKGLEILREILGTEFYAGHLFTTENNFQLDIGKRGRSRLNVAKPTFRVRPELDHDRQKQRFVDPDAFYLKALGVTTDEGRIRDKQQDKWKQINKFVETLGKLVENSLLQDKRKIRITDMGSGKGYLTFATYDYFKTELRLDVEVTGVDTKRELIGLCNDIARSCEFTGLKFVHGAIDDYDLEETDILIALHACNMATDDAIYKGIEAEADLIVVSPCCHQELRPQIKPPAMLRNILKHGILLEREAESITDGLRALLLEKSGYATRVFEFIPTEHTPKNNLIVGTRLEQKGDPSALEAEIKAIKDFYGIEQQRLDSLLDGER
jgi:SAM-dependent methyltransferase